MSQVKLATYVHVADEHDQMHVFGPNDDMSKPKNVWATKKITNPDAWVGGKVPSSVEDPEAEMARLEARLAELRSASTEVDGGTPDDGTRTDKPASDQDGPPPKGGAGSGAPAWREYAVKHDVEVAENASREDVIAALDEAGVPTE